MSCPYSCAGCLGPGTTRDAPAKQPVWRGPPWSETDIFYAVSRYDERTSALISTPRLQGAPHKGLGLRVLGMEEVGVGKHKIMSG